VQPLWDRLHRVQARKSRLGALPIVPADALAVHSVDVDDLNLRIYVPNVRIGKVLYAGAEGLTVSVEHIDALLPSVSGTISGESLVDQEWQRVDLSTAKDTIDAACARLALVLAENAVKDSAHAHLARDECRTLLKGLHAKRNALSLRWSNVLTTLMDHPLFDVAGGTVISLKRALADRPASLESQLVSMGFVEARRPEARAVPEPVVFVPPPPPPKTREEQLQERINETLALVHLDNDARSEFARWPIHVGRFGGKHAVKMTKLMTMVDADHALAKQALDADDHAAFFMLCAVVYGAVNTHLVAVTDDHERAFLARLINHVRR
jgi:hypothetical protein